MSSNLLSTVGLAKKAGRLEIGEEPVGNAARAGQAKLIIVASDAAENSRRRAAHFADAGRVKWIGVPFTKSELGNILGRTSCAMAAFTDTGFAASLVKKLAQADPEQYGEAAQQLDVKAQKVLQRQQEQKAHEKNLREGKKRPWAAPAKPAPVGRDDSARRIPPVGRDDSSRRSPRPVGKITIKKK